MTEGDGQTANGVKYTLTELSNGKYSARLISDGRTYAEMSAARWELSKRPDIMAISGGANEFGRKVRGQP